MKSRTLVLATLIALAVTISSGSIALAAVQPNILKGTQNYNCSLAAYAQNGDWCRSPQIDSGALEVAPYLDSTNPGSSTICVGYTPNSDGSGGTCIAVTGSGGGATSPDGSYYCLSVNMESYSVSISMTCTGYWN